MRSILYWSFLILVAILLAYISPFTLVPLVFVGASAVLGFGYLLFLRHRRRHSGAWEHSRYQARFFGSLIVFVMTYWTTVGLFTNVKEQREFLVRPEPYVQNGNQHGYTFYYLDYAGYYERIDSQELNRFLSEHNPGRVRMVLEVVRDFGKLRAYSVRSVESIAVDKDWTDGNPPWAALRERVPTSPSQTP
jgi:hypothetical protein